MIYENQKPIEEKITSLHHALQQGNEELINSLLNAFGKEEHAKLIEFLMKEDEDKKTALHIASEKGQSHENIVKLLENQTMLCNLHKITQMFKKQNEDDNLGNL